MVVKSHGMIWDSGSSTSTNWCPMSYCRLHFVFSSFHQLAAHLRALACSQELWGDSKLLERLLNFDKDNIPPEAQFSTAFCKSGWIAGCFSDVQPCKIAVGPSTFITDIIIQFDSIRFGIFNAGFWDRLILI